jgi:hypothetical protein
METQVSVDQPQQQIPRAEIVNSPANISNSHVRIQILICHCYCPVICLLVVWPITHTHSCFMTRPVYTARCSLVFEMTARRVFFNRWFQLKRLQRLLQSPAAVIPLHFKPVQQCRNSIPAYILTFLSLLSFCLLIFSILSTAHTPFHICFLSIFKHSVVRFLLLGLWVAKHCLPPAAARAPEYQHIPGRNSATRQTPRERR